MIKSLLLLLFPLSIDDQVYLTVLSALCHTENDSKLTCSVDVTPTSSFSKLIDSLAPMWILPPSKRSFDRDEKLRDEHSEQSYVEFLNESLPFIRRFLFPANQKLCLRANQANLQHCPCAKRYACSSLANQNIALSTNQKLCICLNKKYCLCADLKLCLCANQRSSASKRDVIHLEPSFLLEKLLHLVFSYVTERLQTESYEAHRFLSELILISTEVDRDPSWIEMKPLEREELGSASVKYDCPEATIQSLLISAGDYVRRESQAICERFGASCPCESLLHVMVTPMTSNDVSINSPVL